MSAIGDPPPRVGVRELRQNLSVYLDRVKGGETLDVTEHGHLVARLGPPAPEPASRLDQLIAQGRATAGRGEPLGLGPPLPLPNGALSLSEVLEQMRGDESS